MRRGAWSALCELLRRPGAIESLQRDTAADVLLALAAVNGRSELVESLLRGTDERDGKRNVIALHEHALLWAAFGGHADCVNMLINSNRSAAMRRASLAAPTAARAQSSSSLMSSVALKQDVGDACDIGARLHAKLDESRGRKAAVLGDALRVRGAVVAPTSMLAPGSVAFDRVSMMLPARDAIAFDVEVVMAKRRRVLASANGTLSEAVASVTVPPQRLPSVDALAMWLALQWRLVSSAS